MRNSARQNDVFRQVTHVLFRLAAADQYEGEIGEQMLDSLECLDQATVVLERIEA